MARQRAGKGARRARIDHLYGRPETIDLKMILVQDSDISWSPGCSCVTWRAPAEQKVVRPLGRPGGGICV
jgi:hypothetical protein